MEKLMKKVRQRKRARKLYTCPRCKKGPGRDCVTSNGRPTFAHQERLG